MPNISNATVASGTGLSTAGNGGRKLVRLSNGWLVSAYKNPSGDCRLMKSLDNGVTWSDVSRVGNGAAGSFAFALTNKENSVYLLTTQGKNVIEFYTVDVTSVSNVDMDSASQVGFTKTSIETQSGMSGVSLAINEAGTELHAAWSSKNATYPNSFNIRYAKGTINGDGSVTWGAVEQVSKINTVGEDIKNPSIIVYKDGEAAIFIEFKQGSNYYIQPLKKSELPTVPNSNYNWTSGLVFNGATHAQSNPSSLFIPTAINGLANGRLWVAWHGKDATDSAKFNVRVSYSDDGGVTWATPVKLTIGNTFDCQNVTLGADKTGKVFALYESHQWSPDIGIRMKTFNGSWGAEVGVATANTAEQYPSSLVDYTLQMTTPPTIYTDTTEGIKFVGNFNVGASVSPVSGALGNKETPTLAAYTVTPEAGSTVTQIVERVNGTIVNTFNNPASLSRTLTVPTATWDTLAYFANHTASVTVTDSNGATTVTTYNFDKRLATGASLLEATKANNDAKNRISTKRDALAAQVGLSAGSTFDAISAQLASGAAFRKVATGTLSTSGTGTFTITGLSFTPKMFSLYAGNRYAYGNKDASATRGVHDNAGSFFATTISFTDNGFSVSSLQANTIYNYTITG